MSYLSLTYKSFFGNKNTFPIIFLKFVKNTENNIKLLQHVQRCIAYFNNDKDVKIYFNKLYTYAEIKFIADLPDIWSTTKLISVTDKLILPKNMIKMDNWSGDEYMQFLLLFWTEKKNLSDDVDFESICHELEYDEIQKYVDTNG